MAAPGEAQLVEAKAEAWPLAKPFVIARGAKTEAHVVVAHVAGGGHSGRGEAVPYARYGESVDDAVKALNGLQGPLTRARLPALLPAGAARNALDCALWDLAAKQAGKRAWDLAGLAPPQPAMTCYTLSLGDPAQMAADAQAVAHLKLLKLKLGGDGDPERMAAVRAARPDARLVADANEAWTVDQLEPFLAAAAAAGVELIEQPLPAADDAALAHIERAVPVCADESAHTSADLAAPRRPLRCRQHQARQDRRPHRGAGDGASGPGVGLQDHDRLDGGDLAGRRARRCCSPAMPTGSISTARCCWRAIAIRR